MVRKSGTRGRHHRPPTPESESEPGPGAPHAHRLPLAVRLGLLVLLGFFGALLCWRAGWIGGAPTTDEALVDEGADAAAIEHAELVPVGAAVAGIAWPEDAPRLLQESLAEPTELAGAWKYIVFHHSATSAGGAAAFDAFHRKKFRTKEGVLYQFVIGNGTQTPDGAIEATSRWGRQKRSGHLVNMKRVPDSVAICIVGDLTRQELTPMQYQACLALTRALMKACGIPATRISTHRLVDGSGHTACPGDRFPLDRLRADLEHDAPR